MTNVEFPLILGMFLVTFGVRYPVLAFASRVELPDIILRSLKYIPAAVLSAIIAPAVFMPDGSSLDFSLGNSYLLAGAAAALISWRTKNLLLTILLGMAIFLGLRLFL
jgi:branched-subunit amino acid transport protein